MPYNFDQLIDRHNTDSGKWSRYGSDALPMWVADMDFRSPQPIIDALHERVAHGVFGYGSESPELRAVLVERMQRLYNWTIEPDTIVFLPGLVSGLNVVSRAVGAPGDSVLVNTPVYGPFLTAPVYQDRVLYSADQRCHIQGQRLYYTIDFDALEAAVQLNTRLFILCNPHNPTGRAFTREELGALAALCERHDLVICSDEIHCDLLLGDTRHIPIATLAPEVAARTITLIAPSKTFNIPGLGASIAIVTNPALRKQLEQAAAGIVPHLNIFGMVAAHAAYAHSECDAWLRDLRAYLLANRDHLVAFVERHLPQLKVTVPEATYLAWIDCRGTGIEGNPYQYFLQQANVVLSDGLVFGRAGYGFVRLNFGCSRATLDQGLAQIRNAL